ncbi:MAG: hypothetical protein ABJG86_11090 [Nitratireductor sp.]
MTKITTVQAAHSYGVLDPLVIERRDTKFVGGSLSDGRNIVLLPQGGYTDRGGTTDNGRARRLLSAVALNASITAMPNGGDENDLLAGTAVTVSGATGSRFVLVECDFGTPTNVLFFDVGQIFIATTPAEAALVVEYWNGASWATFGAPARITLGALSRRFAAGGPGHGGITATKFRLALDATTAAGDVTLSSLGLWSESATRGDGVVRRYAPEQGEPHQLVVTAGNVDVYEAGTWRAAIAFPATAQMLREVKFEPKYDTILAFHRDMRPQEIKRLGSSTEWACDDVVFENIPRVDYGGVYANGVNEIQDIILYDLTAGEYFDLTLEGQTTTAIVVNSNSAITASNIKSALEALANVGPGITVFAGFDGFTGNGFRVEFTGEDNKEREWLQMVGTALDTDGYVRVRTTQQGKAPGEDIVSDARGWPSVGRFAQQRLVMAGLKSRPNEVLASVTGQPFDLNTKLEVAVSAFSYEVESSGNHIIRDIIVGRTLIFLGDEAVVYLKNKTLSASEVPEFGVSDAPGIKAEAAATSSDNLIFYIQADGTTLRSLSFTALEENFVADNASVLSAHLIKSPIDIARRRAVGKVNADLIVMVNGEDGTATALTVMRTQEVSGFAPWQTDGVLKSLTTDHDNRMWFLAEREVDGTTELRLEKGEPDKLLDEAVEFDYGSPTATIAGLSRFNGREVWAVADQALFGPFTVSGGEIDLPQAVSAARVGTWIAPLAIDPDISLEEETRSRQARLKRVNRVVISVADTTSLAIGANGAAAVNLPLRANMDTITDTAPLDAPVTGDIEAEGMHGFTRHGRLTVTQIFPGKLTVRSVTKNVAA